MQMENWSNLNDNVRYVQHDEKTSHNLDTDTLLDYCQHKELYCKLRGEKGHTLELDFGTNQKC